MEIAIPVIFQQVFNEPVHKLKNQSENLLPKRKSSNLLQISNKKGGLAEIKEHLNQQKQADSTN